MLDFLKPALDAVASVTSLWGLLAFLSVMTLLGLFLTERSRKQNIVEQIGGTSLVQGSSVIRILKTYKDEKERNKALRELLRHTEAINESALTKVIADVSGQSAVLRSYDHARILVLCILTVFLTLGVIGLVYGNSRPSDKSESSQLTSQPRGGDLAQKQVPTSTRISPNEANIRDHDGPKTTPEFKRSPEPPTAVLDSNHETRETKVVSVLINRASNSVVAPIDARPGCTKVGLVTYDGELSGDNDSDARIVAKFLSDHGYQPQTIHQWTFRDESAQYFERFDAVILDGNFTGEWNPSALIASRVPVIIMNAQYVAKFDISSTPTFHKRIAAFDIVNNAHPITADLPRGTFGVGPSLWTDAVSSNPEKITPLVIAGSQDEVVLGVALNSPHIWFGWYRLSQALPTSDLFKLLGRSIQWGCSAR